MAGLPEAPQQLARISEAFVQYGERIDQFVVLTVTLLADLDTLTIEGRTLAGHKCTWTLEWDRMGKRDMLIVRMPSVNHRPRKKRYVISHGRMVARENMGGVTEVFWV